MHTILSVAGLLALIAMAFGEAAAARVAQAIIIAVMFLLACLIFDIATHGGISSHL